MPKKICSKNKLLLLLVCVLFLLSINCNTVIAEEIDNSNTIEQQKQENITSTSSITINKTDKQKYDKICQKANSLVDKKEYDKASMLLEQAFAINKELDMANAVLSKVFLCQNLNDDNAMFYAQKALSYNSENYIANYVMGKVYLKKNDFEKALTYFNNAIIAKPTFHDPLFDIGIVYCNKKDYNKSVDYLTKYLTTNPGKEMSEKAYFWRMKAYLYGKISFDNALSDVNTLIKFDNKNPEYFSYKGRIYSEMANHRKEALGFADKSIKMSKKDKNFDIYANKIYIYSNVTPIAYGVIPDIDIALILAEKDAKKLTELCQILDGYNNRYYKTFKKYSESLLGKLVEVSQKTLDVEPNNKEVLTINLKAKAEFEKLKISQNKVNLPSLRPVSNTTKLTTGPIISATNTKPVNTNPTPVIAQRSIPKTAPTPTTVSGVGTGTGSGAGRATGGQNRNGRPGIDSMPEKLSAPSWIDTQNPIGPKVYLDANSQYYYGWGAVYTVKYMKDGKPMFTQIELKGLRGNRAAILSVDRNFKTVYNIPLTRDYKNITPDQAIYNSTKMVLNNTKKQTCPDSICKADYGNRISKSETEIGTYNNIDVVKEPDFGPYMRELQRRIKMNWDPPKGNESKRVVLLFKIAKDGRLLSCSVFKSSGISKADKAAISAVMATAPFRPLPSEFKGSSIDIQFTFDYNVFGAQGRY